MKTIAFANHKGGTGKTTTAVNVAACLLSAGKRVLLIDLDPQANVTLHLGIDPGETGRDVYSCFKAGKIQEPFNAAGVSVIPATLDLAALEMELTAEAGRELVLKELISTARGKYDYILIDCPPALGLLTLNALTAANIVIIPVQSEFLAVHGVTKIIDIISKVKRRLNPGLSFSVMVTRYSQNKVLNKNVLDAIKQTYHAEYIGHIRENIAIAEAAAVGKSVVDYSPKSAGAADYQTLTKKIMEL